MTIDELMKDSWQTAQNKGFWDNYDKLYKDNNESKTIRNYAIAEKLMLVTSELGESLEAMRHDHFCSTTLRNKSLFDIDFNKFENQYTDDFKEMFEMEIKDSFEDEITDAFIRLGDLCQKFDIDIEKHIKMKMKYNDTRDKLHGKKF